MYHFKLNDPHFLPHVGCEIDLTIQSGKLLTLVGENGLGKTTLVQRIWSSGLTATGLVEQKPLDVFYDRPLWKIKDILLHARANEISKEFFLSMWEKFGLIKKENRMHSSLSGGEGQVLKICLGLAQKAECYIMDEPSQFLDQEMKSVLNNMIQELLDQNKSILMIEHDYDWVKVHNTFLQLGIVNNNLKGVKSWST